MRLWMWKSPFGLGSGSLFIVAASLLAGCPPPEEEPAAATSPPVESTAPVEGDDDATVWDDTTGTPTPWTPQVSFATPTPQEATEVPATATPTPTPPDHGPSSPTPGPGVDVTPPSGTATPAPDADGDGYPAGQDCDDGDPTVYPGADETCDFDRPDGSVDNDCDGEVDEDAADAVAWYPDEDGDGHGADTDPVLACQAPAGYVSTTGDCDDTRSEINPETIWYIDYDGDGHGSDVLTLTQCEQPNGYVLQDGDCDDTDPAFHPGATESCTDPYDYNCDGSTAYTDADQDGVAACEECDDTDAGVYPGADEYCDAIDNDCDGEVDEDAVDASTFYADADGDGYGDPDTPTRGCVVPAGHVATAGDCDDTRAEVNPETIWYLDLDGDGYGTDVSTLVQCDRPSAYALVPGDCNDMDPAFHPGAEEADCTDPNDYNCDGEVSYRDADADGVAACEDCDDTDATVHPGADEYCDGIDHDCDGLVNEDNSVDATTYYTDGDGDGWGTADATTEACSRPEGHADQPGDCDDGDPGVHPDADEVCNHVDDDCDGVVDEGVTRVWYLDFDGDGYGDDGRTVEGCTAPTSDYVADGGDCDETDPAFHPGADEGCDGLDYNCDGLVDNDGDGDGYPDITCGGTDCNDADPSIRPEPGGGCALGATCKEILASGVANEDGVYLIDPDGYQTGLDPLEVYCDMTTEGGGWTLLGKTVNIDLTNQERDAIHLGTWNDYTQTGYGSPDPSAKIFWLPLEAWHEITQHAPTNVVRIYDSVYELRMKDFSIGDPASDYAIDWTQGVTGYHTMVDVRGQGFTTYDNDNDTWYGNCARDNVGYNGGWWYTDCWQLSMLHSNNNLYSWQNNVATVVTYLYIYFREE